MSEQTWRQQTREWFQLASNGRIVRRACRYAVGVGTLLIAINHGDAIIRADISASRLLRMLMTVLVPYAVSTASSVSALRESGGADKTTSRLPEDPR